MNNDEGPFYDPENDDPLSIKTRMSIIVIVVTIIYSIAVYFLI